MPTASTPVAAAVPTALSPRRRGAPRLAAAVLTAATLWLGACDRQEGKVPGSSAGTSGQPGSIAASDAAATGGASMDSSGSSPSVHPSASSASPP